MLPENLSVHIQSRLSDILGTTIIISGTNPLSGGDINDAFRIETNKGQFFLKYNSASRYPGMFLKEAKGLSLLSQAAEVDIPDVVDAGETASHSYLLLEFMKTAPQKKDFWEAFGIALARLHRHTSDSFGLDHDNYIGSLPQSNYLHNTWISFFISERLERQARMARDKGLIDRPFLNKLEKLYAQLPGIIPVEPPSLIHGDLWSGNYMTGPLGHAVIIDPAVYYGHREMDIGMSRLFGGFGEAFYQAYNQEYEMEPGWIDRVDIYNLYPLLVHVNLFGGGYIGSVESILRQF